MLPDPARAFDFWLGEWEARWSGGHVGRNRVSAILDAHVVLEEFDGRPGTPLVGISVSVFDEAARAWRQTWVDNQGSYLDFAGGLVDGRMELERRALVEGRRVRQRMVWSEIESDRFRWEWQLSPDDDGSWRTLWEIRYTRLRDTARD
jgi:Protein of unknown function (DUF1579)